MECAKKGEIEKTTVFPVRIAVVVVVAVVVVHLLPSSLHPMTCKAVSTTDFLAIAVLHS